MTHNIGKIIDVPFNVNNLGWTLYRNGLMQPTKSTSVMVLNVAVNYLILYLFFRLANFSKEFHHWSSVCCHKG